MSFRRPNMVQHDSRLLASATRARFIRACGDIDSCALLRVDARAAADAVKSRRVKSDNADAYAQAEMLRTGWYRAVYVKSQDSHRLKAMLAARDQLVRAKRALGNQAHGLLRPFDIRLPSRQRTKKFAEAAHRAVRHDAPRERDGAARGVGGDRRPIARLDGTAILWLARTGPITASNAHHPGHCGSLERAATLY
jgi:hypothetical protein